MSSSSTLYVSRQLLSPFLTEFQQTVVSSGGLGTEAGQNSNLPQSRPSGGTGGQPSQRIVQPQQSVGPPSVSGAAKISPAQANLSLEAALDLAMRNNLATLLANERKLEARGLEKEARAGLLPNVYGVAYQANLTVNLAALGFQPGRFPGFDSTFIGPFNNFDARVRLQQTIFSLSTLRTYQAGRSGVRVAELEEGLAREQVAIFTALTYLEVLRSERALQAVQADLNLAQVLFTLAKDQRDAGIATGVDVTRAETRLAQQQVRLAQSQTALEEAQLQLQRVVGLPLGSQLTLTDSLRFGSETLPSLDAAVAQAEQDRPEARIAAAQVVQTSFQHRAARAELLPDLEFLGDYGVSGITPTRSDLPTRRIAVQLNVPIFNGGLTQGRIAVAASLQRQRELELDSTRGQIDEDVRLSFAALRTTAEGVRAADKAVELAQRELEMARDRFRAGVADNLEVVNAQTALAEARAAQVTALVQYNATRLNLAAALGHAQAFRW
ncbi:MAG TPA: TolC family protein [Pyrinomonadaceae bacterium]|nr:TolC family protein [Pyrinomonadaceae bacterium]